MKAVNRSDRLKKRGAPPTLRAAMIVRVAGLWLAIVTAAVVVVAASATAQAAADSVRLTFVTPTVSPGGTVNVAAVVSRKAACKALLTAPDGGRTPLPVRRRNRAGRLSWLRRLDSSAPEGRWRVDVSCGRAGSAHSAFTVKVPVTATPEIAVGRSGFREETFAFTGDTFVDYGVELVNRSPNVAAIGVTLTATIRDAADRSVATDTRTLAVIPAASTFYASGLFLFNVSLTVSSLSVSVNVEKGLNRRVVIPPTTHLLLTRDPSGDTSTLTGEIANPYPAALPDDATVYVVYYDSNSTVIGGDSVTTGAQVQPGATVSFTVPYVPANVAAIGASVDPCGFFSRDEGCPALAPNALGQGVLRAAWRVSCGSKKRISGVFGRV